MIMASMVALRTFAVYLPVAELDEQQRMDRRLEGLLGLGESSSGGVVAVSERTKDLANKSLPEPTLEDSAAAAATVSPL